MWTEIIISGIILVIFMIIMERGLKKKYERISNIQDGLIDSLRKYQVALEQRVELQKERIELLDTVIEVKDKLINKLKNN